MNLENVKIVSMEEKYSRQITNWHYNDEYSIYNLPSYEECVQKNYGITQESNKYNYLVYLLNDEVISKNDRFGNKTEFTRMEIK